MTSRAPHWVKPSFRLIERGREYRWDDIAALAGRLLPLLPEHGRVAIDDRSVAMLIAALVACERARIELVLLRRTLPRVAGASEQIEPDGRLTRLGPAVATTHDFAVLMPTSGTAGDPKLVRHNFIRLIGRIRGTGGEAARWLLTYEPTAFGGLQVILTAIAAGATLITTPAGGVSDLARLIAEQAPTHVSATPSFWRSLLLALPEPPPLQVITLGGETADQSLLDRLAALFPAAHITHLYASTEAGALFTVRDRRAGFPAAWLESGADGVSLRIRNGTLETKSPRAMLNYASGQDMPVTKDGWLITGDLVEIQGDRVLFTGRSDGVVNVGGVKVLPEKIEHFLLALPGVCDAAVIAASNPVTGALLTAQIVATPNTDREALRATIIERLGCLAPAERPRVIDFVDTFTLAGSGKKLRAPAG